MSARVSLIPPLNGVGILGQVGIFHGPPSYQLEPVLAKRGRASERAKLLNPKIPHPEP